MLKLPNAAAVAVQATLWVALSSPWAALADAAPAKTATQSQTTPRLHEGDLVRLRSGGPAMTVKSVWENWIICRWNEGYGVQSAGFPIALIAGPLLSPDEANPQTNWQMSPTELSVRRSGDSSSSGQTNQNPTAQGTNQTGQVRPANAGTSMSPSTRPALPLQQGTGPLQQGTGTNQTIGVHATRARLRGSVLTPIHRERPYGRACI